MKEQLAKQPRPAHTRAATRSHTMRRHLHEHDDEEQTASPHRAGFTAGLHPECTPYTSSEQTTRRPISIEDAETLDDGAFYPQRRPTSVRRYWPVEEQGQHAQEAAHHTRSVQATMPQTVVRYHQRIPLRSSRTQEQPQTRPPVSAVPLTTRTTHPDECVTHPVVKQKQRLHVHWLVYVGLTVLAGVVVFVGVSSVLHWWQGYQDDLHYGYPRTYQCDVRVGHNDAHTPSHFIALNLHKHIEVIEFPGGDVTHAHVYLGPTLIGDGQDLTPVMLTFADVNGDGKLDMLLHIGTQSTLVYLNDNGVFRPAIASDHLTM